ncbi:MAG: hypothetical protein KF767_01750 [Bdellovibrionaceae bacterium]|nr:hypothetical protein [Pseudobdellovibrionaceae bacterium]
MSSDPLSKFLKAHSGSPPPAPADELERILRRREPARSERPVGRMWAGGGLALLSFALAFVLIGQQPEIRQAGMKVAATPVRIATPYPQDLLDQEVSDFFEETLDGEEAEEAWADGEFLL